MKGRNLDVKTCINKLSRISKKLYKNNSEIKCIESSKIGIKTWGMIDFLKSKNQMPFVII